MRDRVLRRVVDAGVGEDLVDVELGTGDASGGVRGDVGTVAVACGAVVGEQQFGDVVGAGVEVGEGGADLVAFDLVEPLPAGHGGDVRRRSVTFCA